MSKAGLKIGIKNMLTGEELKCEPKDFKGSASVEAGSTVKINGKNLISTRCGSKITFSDGTEILADISDKWLRKMVPMLKKLESEG